MLRFSILALCVLVPIGARAQTKTKCDHPLPRDICLQSLPDARDRWQAVLCRRGACVVAFPLDDHEEEVVAVANPHTNQPIVTVSDYADPPTHQRRVRIDLLPLERQLVEREAEALLRRDLFAQALPLIENARATGGTRSTLEWQRVTALYGLGRIDEALASWRVLVAANPIGAYAAAARHGVLRPTLDLPEVTSRRVAEPGTARLHADGTFAGGDIAFAPGRKDVAVVETHPCGDDDHHWLAVGDVRIPLGRYAMVDGDEKFLETGVTVANRFLRDYGYRFDPKAEWALECDGEEGSDRTDARYLKNAKLWLIGNHLRRKAPKNLTAADCTSQPSAHASPPPSVYVPAIDRLFGYTCVMRGCGDGGTDPQYWEEVPLRRK